MAHAIDKIGWTHFTEGKIPLLLKDLQANYLAHCPTMATIDGWMKRFIGQLLELTHSQWIFRNITKHHHTNGTIKLEAREDVLREVERQLDLGLESLPPECKCLLEIPRASLFCLATDRQQYWLNAITAAREAGTRALKLTKGTSSSWDGIVKDGRFQTLSTYNKLPPDTTETETFANPPAPPDKDAPTANSISSPRTLKIISREKENVRSHVSKKRRHAVKAHQTPPPIRGKGRRGPRTTTTIRPFHVTDATRRRDGIGVLAETAVPHGLGSELSRALTPPLINTTNNPQPDRVIAHLGDNTVSRRSFCLLNQGLWIDDEVINFFTRGIVARASPGMHAFSAFFWTILLEQNSGYNYHGVRQWGRRVPIGIFSLRELCIPVNIGNRHWIFVRMRFNKKMIEVWNSSGRERVNNTYLTHALQ